MATRNARPQRRWRPLLLLLVAMLGSSEGQASCPSRCRSCAGEIADCSQSRLTTPPQIYPTGTKTINIEGNHIRLLGSRSFRRQPNIESLKAAGNRIRRLNNDAFWRPFPNLVTLDLSRNRIRRISNGALRNMNQLNTLDLSRNQIRSLRRIFHGTPNLYQLKLTRNHISRLGEHDLSPLTNVHSVDLRSNRLAHIHPRAFKQLTSLRYLFLNNNPIVRMPLLDMGSQVLQMVDLSRAKLTAVPKPFPASTRELRLNYNEVERVNHTDFLSITQLMMFMMNDNKLSFFADGALSHMESLREVWLRNNELVYIPRNLPDTVGRIDMKSNKIQEIESGLFRPTSMLVSLSVQMNRINRIAPNTFSGLPFLQTLDFQSNLITVLETDTFVGLGSLNTILLSNNPLQRIDTGAFRNLGNLTTLGLSYIDGGEFELSYNFLPEMLRLRSLQLYGSPYLAQSLMETLSTVGHVTPLTFLETLDLSHSNLASVPPRIRELFPNIRTLHLDGNPLRCTQSLRWLREWMDEAGSTVSFYQQMEPTCDRPLRLRDRSLSSILDSEWGADDEEEVLSLSPGGAYDAWQGQEGLANDQPQEMRMRGPFELRRGSFVRTPVKVQGSHKEESKDTGADIVQAEMKAGQMSLVLRNTSGVRKTKDQKGGKVKSKRKGIKWVKKDRKDRRRKLIKKGKKGRRPGRKGRKGRKFVGRSKKRERKVTKNRNNRKTRERKGRRRVTTNTSRGRKEAQARNRQ
ncbi:leucine-rich repeat-like protein [Elysia marginata]|uniref:Leucine-rich repeat-like protein n=1 Tax=Elysia marginata TaxID=1093978 RepID=A0AAV4EN38_9GAST|nr:leucine-rich repeat-like protein [Elysia marginata]